jgi:hypothetical protein
MPKTRAYSYSEDFAPHLYLQQLARAWRFLQRYRDSSTHKPGERRHSYYDSDDNLWAFFQNCWHVKEWLKHDTSVEDEPKKGALEAVRASPILALVRDLANGSKHLELHSRTTEATDSGMRIEDHQDGSTSFVHLIKVANETSVTADELAVQALVEWRRILKANGLSHFSPPD